jgi:hypothetical protein
MNKIFRLLLLTFFISSSLHLVGCTKSSQPQLPGVKQSEKTAEKTSEQAPVEELVPSLTPGDFFPTGTGSSWEYQGEGHEFASFSRRILFTRENLAQMREDNGGTVSASVYKITPESVTRIFFLPEAYDQTNYLNNKSTENIVLLKTPLQIGTKWSNSNETREIVDLHATVYTPAGYFTQCLKIKISDANSTVYEYFHNGVGLVKREFISGDTKVTSSLKKHT